MNFYKTTAAFGATACLLMASSAFGAVLESRTFEDGASDTGAAWTGDVSPVADTVTVPNPAGLPISASAGAKVLSVSGSATNEFSSAEDKDTLVDMMVKVSIPDDALDVLDATGAKFAVAVDKTTVNEVVKGVFKYWDATANSNAGGWVALSATPYAADEWVRVTMKFYYSAGKCVVALNGNPCGEYNLIGAANTLASIEVKGSTAIDEVFVSQDTMVANFAQPNVKAPGATYATEKWLTDNNVTWPTDSSAATTLDTQYKLGLDPNGTATTLPLSFEQDTNSGTATLAFPGLGAYGKTGSYVLQSKTGSGDWGTVDATIGGADGAKTATVQLSTLTAGQATYFRILAQAPANP